MYNIETDIGRIFCKYNDSTDDFDKYRLLKIEKGEDDSKQFIVCELDENNHINLDKKKTLTEEEFTTLKKEYTILGSEGVITISNIVYLENEVRQIKDILVIYFPNNKVTKVPDASRPYIVARQGINNIFAMMAGEERVGLAVSMETLPEGYTLMDFMENTRVLDSCMTHVYRTDNATELGILLDNESSNDILNDLFQHEYNYMKNIKEDLEMEITKDSCLKGYCTSIKTFLEESDFMNELFNKFNIIRVDFPMEYSVPLNIDQKALCAVLLNGARIAKAVPLQFDYSINMLSINMKYFLAEDSNDMLWIVPYTESPEEIDPKELYDLTEERTTTLQERLRKVVRAYEKKSVDF